jgi:diguanylate cyclase (GGDEF)-like protein/PAS domain S-box-containing protein
VGADRVAAVRDTLRQLRRDRLTRSSADEGRQLQLCRIMWWFRHAVVTLALADALLGSDRTMRPRLLAVLLLSQATNHAWSHLRPAHAGRAALADGAVLLALTALGLPPLVTLLVCVAVLGWAATFRPVPAVASYLEVLATVALMWSHHHDAVQAGVLLVAFCILAGIFMMRTIRLNMGARRADEHERLVHERLDAVLWEQVPGSGAFTVSPAAERVLGYPLAQYARPGFWEEIVHPDDVEAGRAHLFSGEGHAVTFRVRHADGSWRWLESRSTRVWDRRGRARFAVGVLVDRTPEVEAERDAARLAQELHAQARYDELTGLPNRRCLLETLDERLSGRTTSACALFLLDLDDFKDINDSLGHRTGDQVLVGIGRRIAAAVPRGLVARLGGDEFAILACALTPDEALARGRLLADVVNEPLEVDGLLLRVRASVGLAVYPNDAPDAVELMRRADVAMYRAKAQGESPQRYDPAADLFSRERVQLTANLNRALPNDELVLHYQPLFDLKAGRITALEALARWQHPQLGLVPPTRFIELAEISGEIKLITRWAIRRALADLATLGVPWADVEMSVNLSARNVYEPDFVPWLRNALAELDMPGERLVLEITEGAIMADYPAAVEFLEHLGELGVRTWIDDFGTGHSSLARLRHLPVHGVKIDRSFVSCASSSPTDRNLLAGMVAMIHSLGLATVAEGVEQQDCLDFLADLGCDLAQGYHLGRPAPLDRLPGDLRGNLAPVQASRPAQAPADPLDDLVEHQPKPRIPAARRAAPAPDVPA